MNYMGGSFMGRAMAGGAYAGGAGGRESSPYNMFVRRHLHAVRMGLLRSGVPPQDASRMAMSKVAAMWRASGRSSGGRLGGVRHRIRHAIHQVRQRVGRGYHRRR